MCRMGERERERVREGERVSERDCHGRMLIHMLKRKINRIFVGL